MQNHAEILVLLGIAGLTIPLLHSLGISPVIGFLLSGLAVGPFGLVLLPGFGSWFPSIHDDAMIETFAEFGIISLMFMIGLKLSLRDLWQMRRHILGLGSCQIVATAIIIFFIARQFKNSVEISVLIGACFALSSTAIVMQMLEEKGESHTPVGRLSFSILLMQDLAVVPILALLAAYAGKSDESLWLLTGEALALAAAAIIGIYVVGMKILKPLLHHINPGRRREWLMSFVLFIIIGAATLTEAAGLSTALGAFLAGLLLAETPYRDDIQAVIAPLRNLLMGVFFLSVGMMLDLRNVIEEAGWVFASVIGIGVLKAAILFALCLAFRVERKVAAETSVFLGQSGEFVFVITTMALAHQIIPVADAQFFMTVTAVSMLITPLVVDQTQRWMNRHEKKNGAR